MEHCKLPCYCGQLEKWEFVLNCLANKTINGNQFTILWHVGDLKISHVDPTVADKIIEMLNARYKKEVPMTVTRGKVHDYIGMTLDFTKKGKVTINMVEYVKEAPPEMNGEAETPASNTCLI